MTEPLTPRQIAELALATQPHIELIKSAAPHLKSIELILPALGRWEEVEGDIAFAAQAPEHLRSDIHKLVWARLEKTTGISADVWGAVALLMRERKKPAAKPKPASTNKGPVRTSRAPRIPRDPEANAAVLEELRTIEKHIAQLNLITSTLMERLENLGIKTDSTLISGLRTGLFARHVEEGRRAPMGLERARTIRTALDLFIEEQLKGAA